MEFYLTTAGLAAFVNPDNTGSNALTIDRIGVSSVALAGDPASHSGLLALPNELKRLSTFAGANVGDNVIHVTIRDESSDTYSLRTFGLYASTGVLLAYVTSAAPISEKSPSSMTLIAADLAFTANIAAEVVFGSTDFMNPPATSDRQGVVELATANETAEGTDASRAVTPFGLKSLLTALLAGYSPTGHAHAASDVTSGTFAVARLPDLAQSKIIGLVDALTGKAASLHSHAMSEITGLVAALGLKLAVADFTWQNLVGKPNVAVNGQAASFTSLTSAGSPVWTSGNFTPATKATLNADASFANLTATGVITGGTGIRTGGAGLGNVNIAPGNDDYTGYVEFNTPEGVRVGYIGFAHKTTKQINFTAENGGSFGFNVRPNFAGATPWDTNNFNPTDKAAAIHSHDWAQVTGKPVHVVSAQGHAFGDADWNTITTAGVYDVVPQGAGWHANNPVAAYTFGQLVVTRGSNSTVLQVYNAHTGDCWYRESFNNTWDAWQQSWNAANFSPADKAAAIHSHDWAQITGSRASAADYRGNANDKALTPNAVWAAAQLVALVQAATIAVDMSAGINFTTTMTGNRTLGAPSNAKPGQSGVIEIIQDGTGGRTLVYAAAWVFPNGSDPALTTAPGARDVLAYTVLASGVVLGNMLKAVA